MDELNNKWLHVEFSEVGAEMCRIVGLRTKNEYIWNGDPQYWDQHSPLLFPLVGKLRDGKALIDGKVYEIPKHGFVSRERFERISCTASSVTYRLESKPAMHRIYPFPFRLDVTYKLRANHIAVSWTILNTGLNLMPFHIGGHPGINYPNFDPQAKVKAYASFRKPSPIESASVCNTGCLGSDRYDLPLESGFLPITDECFSNDAIIIDENQVENISIFDANKNPYVSMDFDAPVLLLWSPYGVNAPFVCLEPWYGLCDAETYNGEFANRPYTNLVEPGHQITLGYTLYCDAEVTPDALSTKTRRLAQQQSK